MSDLRQMSRMAKMTAGWIPGIDLGPILDELRDRMAEELDYRLEADNQAAFADAFPDDPDFCIPKLVRGTQHVIVSEWVDGRPLSEIISEGTQAERDEASQLYLEFLLAGPPRHGLLHADPHPGNFRITPDGRLGVVDFGAVNRLPDGMPPELGRLLTAGLEGGADAVLAGLREAGFVKPSIEIDPERLLEYLEPFIAPLRTDEFTFTPAVAAGVFAHINDPRQPNYVLAYKLNLPPEYLLIHRVWSGGIGVLSQLGGTVRGRETVDAFLPGANLPPVGDLLSRSGRTLRPRLSGRMPLGWIPVRADVQVAGSPPLGIEFALDRADVVATALLARPHGATVLDAAAPGEPGRCLVLGRRCRATGRAGEERCELRCIGLGCHGRGLP